MIWQPRLSLSMLLKLARRSLKAIQLCIYICIHYNHSSHNYLRELANCTLECFGSINVFIALSLTQPTHQLLVKIINTKNHHRPPASPHMFKMAEDSQERDIHESLIEQLRNCPEANPKLSKSLQAIGGYSNQATINKAIKLLSRQMAIPIEGSSVITPSGLLVSGRPKLRECSGPYPYLYCGPHQERQHIPEAPYNK